MIKRFLTLALLLLASSFTNAAGPFQVKEYFGNNGGLIDHISPLLIPDNKASAIQNITLDDRGQLSKRSGYTIINTTGSISTNTVTGGGYHKPASGSDFFAIVVGTHVYRTGNTFNGTFTDITSTVTITNNQNNLAQHTSLNDVEIFCNESDPPFKVPATGNALALVGGAPTVAHTCTTYGSYLIVANTTESSVSYPSRIRWSDINNPDSWPALNYIDLEPNDGDIIVSIIQFKDSVYVFKKRSIYRLMITGLDGPDAFIVRPFTRNLGCWAKNSVRIIPNVGIAFLAQNTLYLLGDNELSSFNYSQLDAIGDPIQRTFDTVSRTKWAYAVGGVYPQRYQYWLAVSTDGVHNTDILVYDYIQKAWTTYSGININMLEQTEDSTGANILISGDYNGNIYKQDSGTSDNPSNVVTAITSSYTTGDLLINGPEFTKGFKYLYLFTRADGTTNFIVEAAYDYSTTYEFSQLTPTGLTGAVYDTARYDASTYPAIGTYVQRFELNRSAKSIKLRFSNSDSVSTTAMIGWSIIYSLEDWKQ